MAFEKTWRWFGFNDPIQLSDLRQVGIEGIVTALHHVPNGEVWSIEEIMKVKNTIEKHGMRWSVVESLPVSEGIKIHSNDYHRLIENYQRSLVNLGRCGIDTVCYNFMPVIDWVRTDLHYQLPNGGEVMYFDYLKFVAFDIFILKRPAADKDYSAETVQKAEEVFNAMSKEDAEKLAHNIIIVTQGFIDGAVDASEKDYKQKFLEHLSEYEFIDKDKLRNNLSNFLNDIIPTAENNGIKMSIHPDDPPFPVLGLPRIVSTQEDLEWIVKQVDSLSNGITFCTGSLSVNRSNDLLKIIDSLGDRIHFLHLRNNIILPNGDFFESGHVNGIVDMYAVMKSLLNQQRKRMIEGRYDIRMPLRPDHGIKILGDFDKKYNPGYPLIGRLKGLAELTGMEIAIENQM